MDKSTLSNYGWIVIVTLVLAVMLALATPFGTYVGKGASNVIKTFVQSSDNAIDEDNIDTQSEDWESYLYNDELNHQVVIPDGAIYISINGTQITKGESFPSTTEGDEYIYKSYRYYYQERASEQYSGWRIEVIDKTKETYESPLSSINGEPIILATRTYVNCTNLKYLPEDFKLPNTIREAVGLFQNCTALETLPSNFTLPTDLKVAHNLFYNCSSLKEIPNTMVLHSNIIEHAKIFMNCKSLTGNITINMDANSTLDLFVGTVLPITISGLSPDLERFANPYDNVTIVR